MAENSLETTVEVVYTVRATQMKLFQAFISTNINEDRDIDIKLVIEMKLRFT